MAGGEGQLLLGLQGLQGQQLGMLPGGEGQLALGLQGQQLGMQWQQQLWQQQQEWQQAVPPRAAPLPEPQHLPGFSGGQLDYSHPKLMPGAVPGELRGYC